MVAGVQTCSLRSIRQERERERERERARERESERERAREREREGVWGKSVDLGGRRTIKKKQYNLKNYDIKWET